MAINQNNLDLLINKVLAIEDELALDADALGFMARAMVHATLHHSHFLGILGDAIWEQLQQATGL